MKKWISPDTEKYLGVGLQLAASVLLGFFAGYLLDRKLDTLPGWTLAGFMAGIGIGFYGFFRQLKGLKDSQDGNLPK